MKLKKLRAPSATPCRGGTFYSVTWNIMPCALFSARILPPWVSTAAFAMEWPMPLPYTAPERDLSAR